MKIALVFTGFSYGRGRDFNHCFPNILSTLIEPLRENHEVSIFFSTYPHDQMEKLCNLYKPVEYRILPYEGAHQIGAQLETLSMLVGKQFDFVISTRFDIHFNQPITAVRIDFEKFNVLFPEKDWYKKWKWWPLWRTVRYIHHIKLPYFAKHTTDNLFAFPYAMLPDVMTVLHEEWENPTRRGLMDMHNIFTRVEKRMGEDKVNIVSPTEEKSDINSFYFLCRKK